VIKGYERNVRLIGENLREYGLWRETMRVKGAVGRVHLSRSGQCICSTLVGEHAGNLREGFCI